MFICVVCADSNALQKIIEMLHHGHYAGVAQLPAVEVLDVYYNANKFGFASCVDMTFPILEHHLINNQDIALRTIQLFYDDSSIPHQEDLLYRAISIISPIDVFCRSYTLTSPTVADALHSIKHLPINVRTTMLNNYHSNSNKQTQCLLFTEPYSKSVQIHFIPPLYQGRREYLPHADPLLQHGPPLK